MTARDLFRKLHFPSVVSLLVSLLLLSSFSGATAGTSIAETPISSLATNPELSSLANSDLLPTPRPSDPLDPEAQAAVDAAQASLAENPLLSSSVSTTINSWTNRNPTNPPPARWSQALAYNTPTSKLILFGGHDNSGILDDTWAYDYTSNAWTNRKPDNPPPARDSHALAYDASAGQVILFGGYGSNGRLNDTWAYDYATNAWTNRKPTNPPPARDGHALTYDTVASQVILFGGNSSNGRTNDTWTYDYGSNSWTNRNPANPPPAREGHALIYVVLSDKIILFGGRGNGGILNDTWVYDYASNAWTNRNPANPPPARDGHALAYDASAGKVILFGGRSSSGGLNDTWAYDYGTYPWINRNPANPPMARYGHALAYDASAGKVILFGGWQGSYLNDTWAYDYASNSWTNRNPTNPPPARYGHALAYSGGREGRVILFGGYNGSYLNDTWAYNYAINTWTLYNPANPPGARSMHALAYYSAVNRMVLFGGYNGSSYLNDTWMYSYVTDTWTPYGPSNPPPGRSGHDLAYDASADKMILFGGSSSSSYFNDTWSYNYVTNAWTNRNPTNPPPARSGHALAYNSVAGQVILFGGFNGSSFYNDTWAYDYFINAWTNRTSSVSPPARYSHALAYDASAGKVILFGGYGSSFFNDTWAYSFLRLNYSLTEGWNMISVPLVLEDPHADAVFPAGWPMFAWDASRSMYLGRIQITLNLGEGYWLKVPSAQTLILEGPLNGQTSTSIPLSSGWNLIGTPYPQNTAWGSVTVTRGAETKTLDAAKAAGWIGPFYRWMGTRYESLSDAGIFEPLAGYWMRVFVGGCAIVFPQPL